MTDTPLAQKALDAAGFEIDHLRAEIDTLRTMLVHRKVVVAFPDYVDAYFKRRGDFAKAIGAKEQWVSTMCRKRGYIVVDGTVYSPRLALTETVAALNLVNLEDTPCTKQP